MPCMEISGKNKTADKWQNSSACFVNHSYLETSCLHCVCMQISFRLLIKYTFITVTQLIFWSTHFFSRGKGDNALYQENQIKLCPKSTKLTLCNGALQTGNRLDTYTEQDQSAVAKYDQFMARDIQGHHFKIRVSPVSCMIDSGSNVSSSIGKLSNCIIYADIMKVFPRFFHRVSIIICLLTNSCKLCDIMWKVLPEPPGVIGSRLRSFAC